MQIWRWWTGYCQKGKTYAMVSFAKSSSKKEKVVACFGKKKTSFSLLREFYGVASDFEID